MSAKGEVLEPRKGGEGFQQLVGLGLIDSIVAINPTNAEKAKIFDYELDEERDEIEYVSKNDEGKAKLALDVYYKLANGDFPVRKHRFFLENTPAVSVDDDGTEKQVWVNQVGQTMKIESDKGEEDLPDWFTDFKEWDKTKEEYVTTGEQKSVRRAFKGEDMLMRFLREALNLNYNHPSTALEYNYKKLFAGNVKELLSDLQGELFRKFVVMTQVNVATSADGDKYYEKLWIPNNNFGVPTLPEDAMKCINNGCKFPSGFLGKKWKKTNKAGEIVGGYLKSYTDYPPAGFAPLEPVRVYDPEEDVAAGKGAKKGDTKKKAVAANDDEFD